MCEGIHTLLLCDLHRYLAPGPPVQCFDRGPTVGGEVLDVVATHCSSGAGCGRTPHTTGAVDGAYSHICAVLVMFRFASPRRSARAALCLGPSTGGGVGVCPSPGAASTALDKHRGALSRKRTYFTDSHCARRHMAQPASQTPDRFWVSGVVGGFQIGVLSSHEAEWFPLTPCSSTCSART